MAMRQHVYKTRIQVDFMAHVARVVDNFLAGARVTLPALLAAADAEASAAPRPAARRKVR
jgi:hypothetical protein